MRERWLVLYYPLEGGKVLLLLGRREDWEEKMLALRALLLIPQGFFHLGVVASFSFYLFAGMVDCHLPLNLFMHSRI